MSRAEGRKSSIPASTTIGMNRAHLLNYVATATDVVNVRPCNPTEECALRLKLCFNCLLMAEAIIAA